MCVCIYIYLDIKKYIYIYLGESKVLVSASLYHVTKAVQLVESTHCGW